LPNRRCRGTPRERGSSRWRRPLGVAAGVAGKVAIDVVLLAQTEVGEVSERATAGRGTSSTLPQKHNPVDAVEILAAWRGINAQVAVLLGAMVQEHERAAGGWQAEWPALAETLRLAGGAVFRLGSLLAGLRSTPSGCDATSTSPVASSWRSTW